MKRHNKIFGQGYGYEGSFPACRQAGYIVKGLRLKDFKDEQRNRLTKRASLPLPLDETIIF
jgi:hypothetical protein